MMLIVAQILLFPVCGCNCPSTEYPIPGTYCLELYGSLAGVDLEGTLVDVTIEDEFVDIDYTQDGITYHVEYEVVD